MPWLRMLVLTLALPLVGAPALRAEEPPAVPGPAPAPAPPLARAQAEALDQRVGVLYGQGAYAEAIPLARQALALREAAVGPDHLEVATSLNNLAVLLRLGGQYREARPLLERALALTQAALGPDHPEVALGLSNLALLLKFQGAYAEAQPLYERALAIDEAGRGAEHPDVALDLNNLASLLQAQGACAEARPLFERALAIWEKARGPDHPDVARGLHNLASLLQQVGAYAEARPLVERAVKIQEQALGPEHPLVAASLNNLAALRQMQGDLRDVRALYERALTINEKALGAEHPDVARSLSNLGRLLQTRAAYAEAGAHFARAHAIFVQALGPDHPEVATGLTRLALLAQEQGRLPEARPLLERALAIRERALGPQHPDVATSLCDLGAVLGAQGDVAAARGAYARALAITEAHARAQLGQLSARQRLEFLRSTRHRLDAWLLLAPSAGQSGYAEVLRFRGLVARAETAERILARRARGDDLKVQERLHAAQRLAARLANEVPPGGRADALASWRLRYAEATAERERVTLELAARCAPARRALERLDLGLPDVQARLEADEALVDLLRVGPRYLAWVVRRSGEPVRLDLGPAEPIEAACQAFVAALSGGMGPPGSPAPEGPAGAALRALVWEPIERQLGPEVRRVVLCPDAALAAVPFAALPGRAPGTYLLDELELAHAMNAQDLVPWVQAAPPGRGALLVGGVDYERAQALATEPPPPARSPPSDGLNRAGRRGRFDALPETAIEARELQARLGPETSTLLLGPEATEAAVRGRVQGRRYVHIATHGFARHDLLRGLYDRRPGRAWTSADSERQLAAGHDPMLLAGLALAGANPRDGAHGDDGILTALEASYLPLDGVDLVALSACETARGTPESGEGVQGLVSAFQMAGARHVLASLWEVGDEATRLLMQGTYQRLLRPQQPLSPAAALREAALALRDQREPDGSARFRAPCFWAAFVAYGP